MKGSGLKRELTLNRIRTIVLTITLGSAFLVGFSIEALIAFRPSLDPVWVSVIVAVALAFATLLLMRENRLLRLDAVKPAFGFEFGLWPVDSIPAMWYIKNSGGLARVLRIDVRQGSDFEGLTLPSCGRDELVSLGQDFQSRYQRGGKVSLDLEYQDVYERAGKQRLVIDFDELKRSGRKMPYSRSHLSALDDIAQELGRLRRE